jgi:hypothetical protein
MAMEEKQIEKKIVKQGDYEDVIEIDGHFYLLDKKDKICILPYTISAEGLLDQIRVIQDWNFIEEEEVLTLINGYIFTDDPTDLVAANRILFEVTGVNITQATEWMYLGAVYSNLTSDSPIKLYAVDITNIKIQEDVEQTDKRKKFKIMSSSSVIRTDEVLFLAAYFRLFNYFYVKSLEKK